MRRGSWIILLTVLAIAIAAMAQFEKTQMVDKPVRGGSHDPKIMAPITPAPLHEPRGTLDSIGSVYRAGETWYDQQHNGTAGKMVGVDESGFVHIVWMNGLTSDNDEGARRVYYNMWDPSLHEFTWDEGVVVDASTRAGYTCLALTNDGWVFPTFHQIIQAIDEDPHTAASMDYLPGQGYFATTMPSFLYELGDALSLIWPKAALGRNNVLHVVSTESPADTTRGIPQRIYYSRGIPSWNAAQQGDTIAWANVDGIRKFMEIDTVMVIGAIVAASKHSDRVAIAFPRPRIHTLLDTNRTSGNNDLHLIVSEDGGNNWGPQTNITHFFPPDTLCASGDTSVCERDTFRLFTDCAAMFDRNDNLHLAFTTHLNFELNAYADTVRSGWYMQPYRLYHSDIWHWRESDSLITHVVRGSFGVDWTDSTINSNWIDVGAWQLMVHRPSFAEDTVTGYLYCSYQRYDTMQWAAARFPQDQGTGPIPLAEAYVAVSIDGGVTWSEGTNVTNTIAPDSALPNFCMSERDITLADNVTYENSEGYLHMSYVFDGDGGTPLQEEGSVTLNPVRYHRIPINEIPAFPINPYSRMCLHYDCYNGLAVDDKNVAQTPASFQLYQNYPNPFNPVTNIQFDLARNAKVTLKVFNVLGQNVATLFDGQAMTAGAKLVTFDASDLASGVYIYRLEADGVTAARKMILMK